MYESTRKMQSLSIDQLISVWQKESAGIGTTFIVQQFVVKNRHIANLK